MPLNGRDIKSLNKRAEKTNKLFQEYEQRYKEIVAQVEDEARQWQRDEISRRTVALPHGPKFLQNVISRLGFKKPSNGVKVKVNGKISLVK